MRQQKAMYACCKEREGRRKWQESRREAMAQKRVQEEGHREGRVRETSQEADGRRPDDWRKMWRPLLPRLAGLPLPLLLVVIWRAFGFPSLRDLSPLLLVVVGGRRRLRRHHRSEVVAREHVHVGGPT